MEAQTNPASLIIGKLGGLTKTARMLSDDGKNMAISTVQGWKIRGKIPQEHWLTLIDAAKQEGIDLDPLMFLGVQEAAE